MAAAPVQAPPLTIVTTGVPPCPVGYQCDAPIGVQGGTAPYTWSINAGALPARYFALAAVVDQSLSSLNTVVFGLPTAAGASTFTVMVTSSSPQQSKHQAFTITIYAQALSMGGALTTGPLQVGVFYSATCRGGAAQTARQTLTLSPGWHTIAVATPQAGAAGTQYVFSSWSDGGAASHFTSPATYTARFSTQHQSTLSATKGEVVTNQDSSVGSLSGSGAAAYAGGAATCRMNVPRPQLVNRRVCQLPSPSADPVGIQTMSIVTNANLAPVNSFQ